MLLGHVQRSSLFHFHDSNFAKKTRLSRLQVLDTFELELYSISIRYQHNGIQNDTLEWFWLHAKH